MKKRLGFVSNSSSSSFIIMFDKEPKSPQEIQELLFDYDTVTYYDYSISSEHAAGIIFNEIEKISVETLRDEIGDLINNLSYYHGNDYKWLIDKDDEDVKEYIKLDMVSYGDRDYDAMDILSEKILDKTMKKFDDVSDSKFVYFVNFSDNDGHVYCTLEHGEVFQKVKHIRISHH